MKKLLDFAVRFKPVMGLYLAAAVWFYLLADLIWMRSGVISTKLLWIFVLISMILALLQEIFANEALLKKWSSKAKTVLHLSLTYAAMLVCQIAFGSSDALSILIFTGVFLAVYAIMFWFWSLYYRALDRRLNDGLKQFKRP